MNWEIVNRYLENKCSQKELKQLQDWLKRDAANEDFFQTILEEWESKPDKEVSDIQREWILFKRSHLNNGPIIKDVERNTYKRNRIWGGEKRHKWLMLAAAAVVVGLAFIGVFSFQNANYRSDQEASSKISYRTIITQKGQQAELRLSDGTDIILNAASKLRIPNNYASAKRVVYLQGEAFFKVAHNEAMPFTVKSGELVIQDVGTKFNVSTYDSTNVSVAVKEGAVSVGKVIVDKTDSVKHLVQLDGGKVGFFDENGTKSVSAIQNMSLFSGWTEGKLVFRDTPFIDVVKQLERRFNVNGKILGKMLKQRTLTGTYSHLTLNQILKVLSVSLHVSWQRHHNTIIFSPKY